MKRRSAVLALTLCLWASGAAAQATNASTSSKKPSRIRQTALFLTGAAAALAAHETGHLVSGAALGSHPRIRPLHYAHIPFFKIAHDEVSRRREFVISSAGFWVQHGGSEWILLARPNLREEQAPFLKGMLAFNVGASFVYSAAAFGRFGPPERDTRGMAVSLGRDGIPEPLMGGLILAPAALDMYRCWHPQARWAIWGSRMMKIAAVALTVTAGKN